MTDRMPAPAAGPTAMAGLWRDTRAAYTLGAFVLTLLAAVLTVAVLWPPSGGWGSLAQGVLMVMAALVVLFVPPASWIAWYATRPGMAAALRWLLLTATAALVSLLPLAVLLAALRVAELWLWLAPAIAGAHAVWTAIFLLGARRG